MKSLVEEAQTVGKALEKAWERAGMPTSFTVTVYETPEYGFLGFVKKNAKIGLVFNDNEHKNPENTKKKKHDTYDMQKKAKQKPIENKANQNHEKHKDSVGDEQKDNLFKSKTATANTNEKAHGTSHMNVAVIPEHSVAATSSFTWTDTMTNHVKTMVQDGLRLMGKETVAFSLQPEATILKVIFYGELVQHQAEQVAFFKNFAHLIVVSLRVHFKTEFKNLRLVLARE